MGSLGVQGDPAGMRHLAAQCRARAGALMHVIELAQHSVNAMSFEAPVASRVRDRVNAEAAHRRGDADALAALAERLMQGAAGVDRQVAERRTVLERERQRRLREQRTGAG